MLTNTGLVYQCTKHPQVVRDDGSPVYEYQPRLGESKGNFNQVVVDTDHLGCLLARRYGGDSVKGKGSGQVQP